MPDSNPKAISKLNKKELLAQLELLSASVDFEDDAYDEKTSLKDLRQLVREGREALVDEDGDAPDSDDTPSRLTPNSEGSGSKTVNPTVEPKPKKGEDYLSRFQYKKVDGNPVVGGKKTDPEPGSKAERMKKFLLGQGRVRIMIPVEAGSDPKFPLSVTLNGYRLDLPRATYFDVPEQVANVVMDSQKQQTEALQMKKIDPDTADKALLG